MNVQELSALHKRYVEVSDRFKSSWTFHQFLQGLHKLMGGTELGQFATEFQAVYGLLKEVSGHLTQSSTERVRNELEMVDRRLLDLNRWLIQEDTKVSPGQLRVFFQRVRNYNEGILVQLVKFYLYLRPSLEWTQDHHDKIDFLITKVSEESQSANGPWSLQERSKVKQTFNALWALAGPPQVDENDVEEARRHIQELRRRLLESESFDHLIDGELVAEYRRFKFHLGKLFFHPDVLLAVVETNLALRNHIQQLYRREEQRIVADYQRIFELERVVAVDTQLDLELAAFREEVERFEKNLQNESLSLEELRRLRLHVRTLVPRLTELRDPASVFTEPGGRPAGSPEQPTGESRSSASASLGGGAGVPGEEALSEHYNRLLASLDGVSADVSAKVAVFSPELFPYRLEAREVVAFRRLARADGDNVDSALESFILLAAALRARAQEEIEEIRGILDDTVVTRDAPVFGRAKQTTRIADLFVRRFSHELDQLVLRQGDLDEARELQVLKMRLVRESAGLWLLVHKS